MAGVSIIDQYKSAGASLHDAIKTLRTNIGFSSIDKDIKTIVITSVVPHDGKSTISIFLGIAMAQSIQKTLLIECDCRRPMLQNYLGLRPEFTLVDVLRKHVNIETGAVPTSVKNLDLLTSMVLANPVEILGSHRFKTFMDELKSRYDVIIFDTPPLGSFIEAAIIASKADGTILVLQPGSTDVTAAQAVVSQLEKAKANVLGVVLNGIGASSEDYYYANYYAGKKKKKRLLKVLGHRQPGLKKESMQNIATLHDTVQ